MFRKKRKLELFDFYIIYTNSYLVTAPLATHPLMAQIMQSRIDFCIQAASASKKEFIMFLNKDS